MSALAASVLGPLKLRGPSARDSSTDELLGKRKLFAQMLAVEQQRDDRCPRIFIVPGERCSTSHPARRGLPFLVVSSLQFQAQLNATIWLGRRLETSMRPNTSLRRSASRSLFARKAATTE